MLVVIFVLGRLSGTQPAWADVAAPAAQVVDDDTPKDLAQLRAIEQKFKDVAAKAVKCVVGIQIGTSRGSGVIVSPDGLILTAGHVAARPGSRATITTSDGKSHKGMSLGIYSGADAGMMKITDKGEWPCVRPAPKGKTQVGDWCLAMGHPLGYMEGRPPVVRMGRVLDVEERTVQTDCPLIVGDSGGPLLNLDGEVIGINSRISGAMSMNYHVPVEIFHTYWDRLKKGEAWVDGTLRDAGGVKDTFRKVIAQAAACVVRVRCDKRDVAMGTIVGPDGWILTKASELKGRVVVRLPDGRDLEARKVGVNPRFDLAMLKIDAVDLPKIAWGLKDPAVGQWVAVPGPDGNPLALGVISVPRRTIPRAKGSLGILFRQTDKGVTISMILPGSPAARAGIMKDDLITQLNGRPIKNQKELVDAMKNFGPGMTIRLTLRRGEKSMDKTATLGQIVTPATRQRDALNSTGVGMSGRHDDFPVVLQHDATVRPADCGSPVVTLDGRTVGINVARGGRTETYCIPANALVVLMYELMSGHLRPEEQAANPAEEKKPETEAKPEEQKKPDSKEEVKPETKPIPQEKPKAEVKPAPKEGPKPEAKPAPKEEPKAQVVKPVPKEEPKPEIKPVLKKKPQRDVKPAPKESPKTKDKPAPKQEASPEQRPTLAPPQEPLLSY